MAPRHRARFGRREWLVAAGFGGSLGLLNAHQLSEKRQAPVFSVGPLTSGPKHHFFGYYGIPPWNLRQSHLLSLEVPFQDRMPLPDEPASLGLVDATTGKFQPVAETQGWNFQQGAMLHWHPADANRYFIHNNRRGSGDVFGEVRDLTTGEARRLPRAVNGVARNHPYALCLNYGRLTRMRPVVGYPGLEDITSKDPHPANDGAWVMDIDSGEQHLAVSIDAVFQKIVRSHPWVEGQHMWFNHVVFNPSATRFFFLARVWTLGEKRELESAMFTANRDGSELREVVPFGKSVSHFEWRNDTQILATFKHDGEDRQHVLFTDGKPDYQVVAREYFVGDGHCSFAPDGDWMVTDRNNGKTLAKELRIYSLSARKGHYIGSFPMREKKYLGGDLRCDLHPRWSRDGKHICFDALHPEDATRQLHIATLPALTALG